MIGNGHFAQILRSIITDPSPTITYAGPEQQDGRSIFRYRYRVPTFLSGYRLRNIDKEAIVGHHGLIWIDPVGHRLLKIHMDVDDIPPHFGFAAVSDDLFYGAMQGDQRLLAPLSAETIVSMESGRQDRLRTYFSHWRKYRGESQISFGSSPPVDPAFQRARDTKPIGAGIRIPLRLDTAIDIAKASVGDSITGTVLDSSRGGPPTGATVEGVIRTIDHISGATVLGIQFFTISFDGKTIPLYASLIEIGPHPDLIFDIDRFSERLVLGAGKVETYTSESFVYPRVPGVGKFALRENVTRVSAGLRMVWLTE